MHHAVDGPGSAIGGGGEIRSRIRLLSRGATASLPPHDCEVFTLGRRGLGQSCGSHIVPGEAWSPRRVVHCRRPPSLAVEVRPQKKIAVRCDVYSPSIREKSELLVSRVPYRRSIVKNERAVSWSRLQITLFLAGWVHEAVQIKNNARLIWV